MPDGGIFEDNFKIFKLIVCAHQQHPNKSRKLKKCTKTAGKLGNHRLSVNEMREMRAKFNSDLDEIYTLKKIRGDDP